MNPWFAFLGGACLGCTLGLIGGRGLAASVRRAAESGNFGVGGGLFKRSALLLLGLALGARLGLAGCVGAAAGYLAGLGIMVARRASADVG
jgi:hypothetical protein